MAVARQRRVAPLFAAAVATQDSRVVLLVGLSAASARRVSMGVSEGLSDDGSLTGRGGPLRGAVVTGLGTLVGAGGGRSSERATTNAA